MKTILEIFYVRIIGDKVRYQRKEANLSKKGGDPARIIQSLIQEKRRASSGKVEKKEFIVHSTSWRYARAGKVMLTYVAYSDELDWTGMWVTYEILEIWRARAENVQGVALDRGHFLPEEDPERTAVELIRFLS